MLTVARLQREVGDCERGRLSWPFGASAVQGNGSKHPIGASNALRYLCSAVHYIKVWACMRDLEGHLSTLHLLLRPAPLLGRLEKFQCGQYRQLSLSFQKSRLGIPSKQPLTLGGCGAIEVALSHTNPPGTVAACCKLGAIMG